ncbi:MAG: hypothetical protein AAF267_04565 [Deinococcota bacterium]
MQPLKLRLIATLMLMSLCWAISLGSAQGLATTFAGGNGQAGNMFDVTTVGTNDVTITQFYLHVDDTSSYNVNVYFKAGSYVGFDQNPGAWTLFDTVTVTGQGVGNPSPMLLTNTLTIPAGQTYGIYIDLGSNDLDYTTGANTYTDGVIQIDTGVGKVTNFGATYSPRTWNGAICYSIGTPSGDCQFIIFGSLASRPLDDGNFTVNATASSGLDVSFSSAPPAVCTTGGVNGSTVTLLTAGTCTINANQAGNASFNAASQVQQSFTVIRNPSSVVVNMFDSFGDGWNGNTLDIIQGGTVVATAGTTFTTGSFDMESLFLPCGNYTVNVGGGAWQNEVSWNIEFNGIEVLSGGAPETGLTITTDECPPVINPNQDIQIRNGNSTSADSITSNGLVPLSYGMFKRSEDVVLDYLVRNPGAKVLELGELVLPSFLSVEGDTLPESLGSFESALLQVRIDTSTAGTLEGQVSLASNDPDANENPFVFDVIIRVSDEPANVVNVVAGVEMGEVNVTLGQGEVALLSFYLSVPEGSVDVDLNSLNLGSTNLAGIAQATSLKLYIDGGTRGQRDQGDILLATLSGENIQTLSFGFPTRTLKPNLPLWLLVVGEF